MGATARGVGINGLVALEREALESEAWRNEILHAREAPAPCVKLDAPMLDTRGPAYI